MLTSKLTMYCSELGESTFLGAKSALVRALKQEIRKVFIRHGQQRSASKYNKDSNLCTPTRTEDKCKLCETDILFRGSSSFFRGIKGPGCYS